MNVNNPNNPAQTSLDEPDSHSKSFAPEQKSQHEFDDSLPPSKLLNSVKGEPGEGQALKRFDTETQEEEQFHDAHS